VEPPTAGDFLLPSPPAYAGVNSVMARLNHEIIWVEIGKKKSRIIIKSFEFLPQRH
jgi:hypothetical protein